MILKEYPKIIKFTQFNERSTLKFLYSHCELKDNEATILTYFRNSKMIKYGTFSASFCVIYAVRFKISNVPQKSLFLICFHRKYFK